MAMLTKEQILAAEDRRQESVEVPEWGGTVIVRTMSALQRDRWQLALMRNREDPGSVSPSAMLVASCLVNEAGEPLFTPADVAALEAKSGAALSRVFAVAAKLNVLGQKDADELKGN